MAVDRELRETVVIRLESDVVSVRRTVRNAAEALGFGITDVTRIVTAASELARNIVLYAGSGTMELRSIHDAEATGIELNFEDNGPGIANIEQALAGGYSTGGGLGLGLPGARRLMDDMRIKSEVGKGTTIAVTKWLKR